MAARDYKVFEHGAAGQAATQLDVDEWIKLDIEAIQANAEEDKYQYLAEVRLVATHMNAQQHLIMVYEREYKSR